MKAVLLIGLTAFSAIANEEICLDPVKDGLENMMEAVDCNKLDRGLTLPGNQFLHDNMKRGKAALDTCLKDDKFSEVPVMPLKPVAYFEQMPVDCKNELENLKSLIALGHTYLKSSSPDVKTMEATLPEGAHEKYKTNIKNYYFYEKYQPFIFKNLQKPLDVKHHFELLDRAFCFSYHEEKKNQGLTMADCKNEVSKLVVDSPKVDCQGKGVSAQVALKNLESLIRDQKQSCGEKVQGIKNLFSTMKLKNIDDLSILTVFADNIQDMINTPKHRQLVGAALASANPVPLGADETLAPEFFKSQETPNQGTYNSSVINMRMALLSLQNKKLEKFGITRAADLCRSQNPDLLVKAVAKDFSAFLKFPEKILSESREFSQKCDRKIASIFGDENTVAATCGHDHVGKHGGQDRSHTFINAHFYPNKEGKGTGPLFAPKGMTSMKLIPGMASQGCYKLEYANGIGDLKGAYVIDFCHTGAPNTGRSMASLPKNNRGSVQIGTLAGVGGSSAEENYNHSHLQLRNSKGRVNFVDAFCRNTED